MHFTGEDTRDFGWEEEEEEGIIKGFVMSNAFVDDGLDFKGAAPGREERLVGETKETLFIEESIEGVNGVFASERARAREGVFGWLFIWFKELERTNNL